jgi:hypothetical protein
VLWLEHIYSICSRCALPYAPGGSTIYAVDVLWLEHIYSICSRCALPYAPGDSTIYAPDVLWLKHIWSICSRWLLKLCCSAYLEHVLIMCSIDMEHKWSICWECAPGIYQCWICASNVLYLCSSSVRASPSVKWKQCRTRQSKFRTQVMIPPDCREEVNLFQSPKPQSLSSFECWNHNTQDYAE